MLTESTDLTNNDLTVGVISDSALQRHALQHALDSYGLNVGLSCTPELLTNQLSERIEKVGCWILELADEEYESLAIDQLISQSDIPVLMGLGKAPAKQDECYISWERRLFSKLSEHLSINSLLDTEDSILALDQKTGSANEHPLTPMQHSKNNEKAINSNVAKQIWVLAASLGGPAAVKEFLDELPSDICAGFLYAQHVNAHFSNVLTQVLGRHSALDLKPLQAGHQVHEGEVLVVPVDHEVLFAEEGAQIKNNKWQGPYGPSIDHLLQNLFKHYGDHCHVILFSGMGNDGALTVPIMKRSGCTIWTQTPSTCANGSMPQSIIDLNCSDLIASPKQLAMALIKHVGVSSN